MLCQFCYFFPVTMAELVERLAARISSDEEVIALQKLHSLLSAENKKQGADVSADEFSEASIELFGRVFLKNCWFAFTKCLHRILSLGGYL